MTNPACVIVLTTLPASGDDPSSLARTLVEERLAACVNVLGEMRSVYAWEGAVEEDLERQVVIKTARDRLGPLWDRVRSLHAYEVPEFVVLPVIDGHDAYLAWIVDATRPAGAVDADADEPA